MQTKKLTGSIGLLGGSFHPIHNGHLEMARIAAEEGGMGRVLFIPAGDPPHKILSSASPGQRYEMACLAVKDDPRFDVLDIEIKRQGRTYTIDTVKALQKEHPDADFRFVIGSDTLLDLDTWKHFDELFVICKFFVIARVGTDRSAVKEKMRFYQNTYHAAIRLSQARCPDISSTQVRADILAGRPWEHLVPDGVAAYIREHHLYTQEGTDQQALENIAHTLRQRLPESRWQHTLRVVDTARRLAGIYGVDDFKAHLAALVHDCAKPYKGDEALAMARKCGVQLDDELLNMPSLWHGPLGAGIARYEYGVGDEDILNAVRYHSTGCAGMTPLVMITKLADFIEPHRRFSGVEAIRKAAFEDKDMVRAVRMTLISTQAFMSARGKRVHPDSVKALKWLEQYHQNKEEFNAERQSTGQTHRRHPGG
ncbi:MAG: nicotinate-nucleotide adenylyltransferase [Christensenellales bacterium]|jgi:nicotinate-nucleotide adenylyltransferase